MRSITSFLGCSTDELVGLRVPGRVAPTPHTSAALTCRLQVWAASSWRPSSERARSPAAVPREVFKTRSVSLRARPAARDAPRNCANQGLSSGGVDRPMRMTSSSITSSSAWRARVPTGAWGSAAAKASMTSSLADGPVEARSRREAAMRVSGVWDRRRRCRRPGLRRRVARLLPAPPRRRPPAPARRLLLR